MLIHEVTSSLQLFSATVRVATSAGSASSFKTAVHAESAQHARQLLIHLYGVNSVTGLVLVRGKLGEAMTTAASGPLTADQLRLKALSDQKAQIGQRERQERARQKLVKAQQQMAQSRQTAIKMPTLEV